MAEFRTDPLTGQTVLLSSARSARPHAFGSTAAPAPDTDDPFAPGQEWQTPPELFALRSPSSEPDTPGWSLRVVPNSYPAVDREGDTRGRHEVVIEAAGGAVDLAELSLPEVAAVVRVWRDRLRVAEADQTLAWGTVFKNSGPASGASLVHAHSQLLAIARVPEHVERMVLAERQFFEREGRCATCDQLLREQDREQATGTRIVMKAARCVLHCPWASRFALEMRITPNFHAARFTEIADEDCTAVARLLRIGLRALRRRHPHAPYNVGVRTIPFHQTDHEQAGHWWIELLPRLGQIAGFELASGMYLNTVDPDVAAAQLRETVSRSARGYQPCDLPLLAALFQQTVRRVNSRDYSPAQILAWAPDEIDLEAWRRRFAASRVRVVEIEGEIAGFANFEADGHLDMFFVHADWQGQGVGRCLLDDLETAARAAGITKLFTEASITARPFFERMGYRHLAEQTVEVRGQSFLNHRMEKRWS